LKKVNLAVVHFQPLEGYPPVMNVIQSLIHENISVEILTTGSAKNWFIPNGVRIFRLGSYLGNSIKRYVCYLKFNIIGLWKLLNINPSCVICYETASIVPVYLFKLLKPKTRVFIHYHEYESVSEKASFSGYQKFLGKLESKLLKDLNWLSHTNIDRLEMFKTDNAISETKKLHTFPNYPSMQWAGAGILKKRADEKKVLKLVYVGSLGLHTTYIADVISWIAAQNGKATLTIYSQNLENAVTELVNNANPAHVILKPSISYFELPEVICQFDVGLVLYNGHIPNFILNVPNKVNEYLACGLNVWYSDVLVTTQIFSKENPDYPLFAVDFSKGIQMEVLPISEEPFEYRHWHEDAVKPLIDALHASLNDSVHTP
jgi:hypothetical protein